MSLILARLTVGGFVEADFSSDGLAVVLGNANAIWDAQFSSTGLAIATGVPAAIWNSVFNSAGLAAVDSQSSAIWAVVYGSDGTALVLGIGEDAAAGTVEVHLLMMMGLGM